MTWLDMPLRKMKSSCETIGKSLFLGCALLLWVAHLSRGSNAIAQDAGDALAPSGASQVDRAFIDQQIRDLSHDSYRTRQLARWRLEQYPDETVDAIRECIDQVDYNTGAQLIDLLSSLAAHGDVSISVKSREILSKNANRISSIGRLADNAVRAIADLQEEQAFEILVQHGAKVGLPSVLNFNLNARVNTQSDELALWIDGQFDGSDTTIEWIQFLKSVETIFFEGSGIHSNHFRAIARLPNIKNVKLKRVSVSKSDLELLKNLPALELLELSYVGVGDELLSTIAELPISQSLRLYGTRISQAGAEQLAKQLDGIEIYCGKGGYLGVATDASNTIVTRVIHGSAANLAGIDEFDELTKIEDVAIKNFADLRRELGKYMAGEKIKVSLKRRIAPSQTIELVRDVTLGEDPN